MQLVFSLKISTLDFIWMIMDQMMIVNHKAFQWIGQEGWSNYCGLDRLLAEYSNVWDATVPPQEKLLQFYLCSPLALSKRELLQALKKHNLLLPWCPHFLFPNLFERGYIQRGEPGLSFRAGILIQVGWTRWGSLYYC